MNKNADNKNENDEGIAIIERTIIAILLFAVIAFPAMFLSGIMSSLHGSKCSYGAEKKSGAKKAMSVLNQAIVMGIAQDKTDLSKIINTAQLTNHFKNKMNTIASNSSQVTTADAMSYYFNAKGKCGDDTSTNNQDVANCTVTVNVSGPRCTNGKFSEGNSTTSCIFKEKYIFVLKKSVVVPGNSSTSLQGADCTVEAIK